MALTLLQQRTGYAKIRLIGIAGDGQEIIRVERRGRRIFAAQDAELQKKGTRPYFLATLTKPKGNDKKDVTPRDRWAENCDKALQAIKHFDRQRLDAIFNGSLYKYP